MRGKHFYFFDGGFVAGITPAYAGETSKFGAKFDNFAEYAHGLLLYIRL